VAISLGGLASSAARIFRIVVGETSPPRSASAAVGQVSSAARARSATVQHRISRCARRPGIALRRPDRTSRGGRSIPTLSSIYEQYTPKTLRMHAFSTGIGVFDRYAVGQCRSRTTTAEWPRRWIGPSERSVFAAPRRSLARWPSVWVGRRRPRPIVDGSRRSKQSQAGLCLPPARWPVLASIPLSATPTSPGARARPCWLTRLASFSAKSRR
jgi:hypothetical protein